ncbi:MAG: hypothetical protein J7M19_09765 [Planctomycetes bacterium]|nr:hypothetical protein [Planctomycetota bacterium]
MTLKITAPALLTVLVLSAPGISVETTRLGDFGAKDFSAGQMQDVYVDRDGRLVLGPRSYEIMGDVDHAWCAAVGPGGTVYVGTVPDGRVYRVREGKSEVFFDTKEAGVFSIALLPDGRAVAGTGSEGKVWIISPDGDGKVLADLDEKYVFALAVEKAGSILAATGADAGRVYRLSVAAPEAAKPVKKAPGGAADAPKDAADAPEEAATDAAENDGAAMPELLWESPGKYLLALALGPKGRIYAASGDKGAVYEAGRGKARVLFSAPQGVVQALAVGADGTVYAATAALAEPKPGAEEAAVKSILSEVQARRAASTASPAPAALPTRRTYKVTNVIYSLQPAGSVRKIFSIRGGLVLTLLVQDGRLLAGTAGKAGIYSVPLDGGRAARIYKCESDCVHDITACPSGGFVAALGMPGKVVRFQDDYARKGVFTSRVLAAGDLARWGRIQWDAAVPTATLLTFDVRAGNTPKPDSTWTEWETVTPVPADAEGPLGEGAGGARGEGRLALSPSRYVQYRVGFATASGEATASIKSVAVTALPINLPPEVASISAGKKASKGAAPGKAGAGAGRGTTSSNPGPPQALSGTVTISWKAEDPNGDKMRYDLAFRDADMKRFITLEEDLSSGEYKWDTTSVPDGAYYFRVEADDAPSNPEGTTLQSTKVEGPFTVDNTAPATGKPKVTAAAGGACLVEVEAVDAASPLGKAYWSVDGGKWRPLFPVDGIFDSRRESLSVEVGDADAMIVVIRVVDRAGNQAAVKALLEGPTEK